MTRFGDYKAIVDGATELRWKHELLSSEGEVLATTDEDEAGDALVWLPALSPLRFSLTEVSKRTASLVLPVSDKDLMPKPGSLLHPDSGNRVRSHAGITKIDGEVAWWTVATMLIEQAIAYYEQGACRVEIDLADALHPIRSDLEHSFGFSADEPVEDVVGRLLGQVLDADRYEVAPTECTIASGSFSAGESRERLIIQLLDGCGHEITADPWGFVFTREIPDTAASDSEERWSYGTEGIPVDARRIWRSRVPQGWKVEGGSLQSSALATTLIVFDTDERSEGYYSSDSEIAPHIIGTSRLPFVSSMAQAAKAGYAQLRRHGTGPGIVEVVTVPNPALVAGDLVDLTADDLNATGTYRVVDFTLPVEADDDMAMLVRGVWDPALNMEPPVDRGEGCVTSITSNFSAMPDGNLENLEGSPGSDDWTEQGWSWGIKDGRAIQRGPNTWSLGFLNTPLCSVDQYAECEDIAVPWWRQVGPVVRSTGAGDGYAALAHDSGWITLEVWQNLSRVAELGWHNAGGSVDTRNLRIEAVGNEIRVKLDADIIITATDDRRTGSYVGMLGYGASYPGSPSVGRFTAGVAT